MFEPVLDNHPIDISSLSYSLKFMDDFVDMDHSDIDDAHIHDCFEVYMNISGDVCFFVKNNIFPISRGDIIFTRPSELHRCIYNSSCVHTHFCLWFDIHKSEALKDVFQKFEACLISPPVEKKELLISKMYELKGYESKGMKFEATTCLLSLLMLLVKETTEDLSVARKAVPAELQTILDHINIHFNEIANVNQLYDDFFISAATLNRWFVKYLHMPPKNYLEYIKLSNAKRLLGEGKSVTDVCFECGYSDCSHFIRVFKAHFGKTPLQYKNEK